jgi:hypothetical protein
LQQRLHGFDQLPFHGSIPFEFFVQLHWDNAGCKAAFLNAMPH